MLVFLVFNQFHLITFVTIFNGILEYFLESVWITIISMYPPVGVAFTLDTTNADYACVGQGYQVVLFNIRVTEVMNWLETSHADLL